MPSIVRRNSAKNGLVLLNSNVSVAEDGFVSINARWLAPAAGLGQGDFLLDSEWPLAAAPLPLGAPSLQGGPFLIGRSVSKQNGLLIVETNYISAIAPFRIKESRSTERASFSGYAEDKKGNSGSVSFDYSACVSVYDYSVVGGVPEIRYPDALPGIIYNFRTEGKASLVLFRPSQTITGSREVLGRVARFSITAKSIYEQYDPTTGSTPVHDSTYFLNNTTWSQTITYG
jgi:hypothetical protein